jgi:signal transduction histidine kinase
LINEKGNLIYKIYTTTLSDKFEGVNNIRSINDIKAILKGFELENKNDIIFIIQPNSLNVEGVSGTQVTLSPFFLKYLKEIAFSEENAGHIFDYYGVDIQGAAIRLQSDRGAWIIGVKYEIAADSTLTFFVFSFFVLLFVNIIVLRYFAGTLADDVSRVANNLTEIAQGETVHLDKKLAVTSSDEISDLVIAFNKIIDKEKESMNALKENQTILLEQERLASLGQLIGGIAHNLKTPIMSISGGIEALKDLAYEYRDSIDDKSVTEQDHKEIAKEMLSWLDKMRPYCSYMSDVISAVKGQAVQMNASTTVKFTVDELLKRVDLLLKHELKKYHCVLKMNAQIDLSTEIKGEVNNLVQVFDNIIINAMQSYDGQMGTIDLNVVRSGDNVEFTFRDYGKGIPKQVAEKLFKEMITTKGKNGTGLGLYMSYSTIKGRFGGNMSFTSREGGGTTFFISIPCIRYGNQEAQL